jgi:putative FmdB family regulatory protein
MEETMPTFEFHCKKCDNKYEALTKFDNTGKYKDVVCPECGSKSKEKLMSVPTFAFAQPQDTDVWNSESKGHDYRFKYNIPKVKEERAMAEALSHMGADPYGSSDMLQDDIELDTGIHDPEVRKGLS